MLDDPAGDGARVCALSMCHARSPDDVTWWVRMCEVGAESKVAWQEVVGGDYERLWKRRSCSPVRSGIHRSNVDGRLTPLPFLLGRYRDRITIFHIARTAGIVKDGIYKH